MLKKFRNKLANFAPALLFHLAKTWRIHVTGEMPQGAAVVAFWHDEMLPAWKHFADTGAIAVISLSRDGGIYSQLAYRWGFDTVRGSSSKGGSEAFSQMIDHLRAGRRVCITPDGPRGPRHVMKRGAIAAAHRAKVPLVLCRVTIGSAIRGSNWDRFQVPLPFSRIDIECVTLDMPAGLDRPGQDRLNTYAENLLKRLTPLL